MSKRPDHLSFYFGPDLPDRKWRDMGFRSVAIRSVLDGVAIGALLTAYQLGWRTELFPSLVMSGLGVGLMRSMIRRKI